jgi:hypothetical protein
VTPEDVFRFVNVRPVQQASKDNVAKRFTTYGETDQKSPLHKVIEALPAEGAREAAVTLSAARLAVNDGIEQDLRAVIDAARASSREPTVAKARESVKKALGQLPDGFLKSDRGRRLKDVLWDRLYAHTLVPENNPEDREEILGGLRAMHFLDYLIRQEAGEAPLSRKELELVRATIPPAVVPAASDADETWREAYMKGVEEKLRAVHGQVVGLNVALVDLHNNEHVYRETLRRKVDELPPIGLVRSRTARLEGSVAIAPRREPELSTGASAPVGADGPVLNAEEQFVVVPARVPWIFDTFGETNLSGTTKETLAARRAGLQEREFPQVVAALEGEKHALVAGLLAVLPRGALQRIRATPEFTELVADVALDYPLEVLEPELPAPGTAAARGITPLGVGDLLVVRQDVRRYEPGELAHVENVLKSETKKRRHSRLRETEDTVVTEVERTEESEKDLQTTERFELQKESQKTIESQMSLDAGLAVTASYGPVSVTAHADFALSQSSSEAARTASTFAKQVTEQSVARIRQRTREERTRRTLERFEEVNEHGFENTGPAAANITGVYRWIDKYYRARLINYGRRMMIEFIVPEPAAFYLAVQGGQPLKGVTLEKPTEPQVWNRRLRPDDLTKWNYTSWVAKYSVQDVESYPDEVVRVSAAFAEAASDKKNSDYAKTSEKLVVPDGYECEDVYGQFGWMGDSGSAYFAECFIAGQSWGSVTASGLQGIIPISVKGWLRGFHVNVVALCRIKPETIAKWQAKMYEAIMNAYDRALADYNEQVAAAQIQSGVDIQGRNPDVNRRIEKDELRKGVMRLLTNDFAKTRVGGVWRFNEAFDAMQSNGTSGYPDFDVAEAIVEGRIIQFFEQAFEWNNMTYRFYPYFWGREARWGQTFPLADPDPLFVDFLRAGSARVVVPAHPAYDETLLHYMATDEIWNGGTPPTLHDPLYISLVDELKSDAGTDLDAATACEPGGDYPCLIDEWEVKLPTDLVYLEKDAKLPSFTP